MTSKVKEEKIKRMCEELMICAVEQGYFIKIDNRINIELQTYFRLKEILEEELNTKIDFMKYLKEIKDERRKN